MAGMNRKMNLPALQQILREFERQNERMEMTSEVRHCSPLHYVWGCPSHELDASDDGGRSRRCA